MESGIRNKDIGLYRMHTLYIGYDIKIIQRGINIVIEQIKQSNIEQITIITIQYLHLSICSTKNVWKFYLLLHLVYNKSILINS